MMIRGIPDVATAFIMGWIGTGCPVRHQLKPLVCDCLRNRSESSVFYSCRFSFSGLVAAKLAAVMVIWRSVLLIRFLDKSHIAFSFYIRRTIVFNLSNHLRLASNCIQASPALRDLVGRGPVGRLAAPTEKEIAFIYTNL